MFKKVTLLIVISLLCTLLALWSPWLYWNIDARNLFGIRKPDSISGLQVFSLGGELNIQIDGKDVGSVTPEKSPFFYDTVTPGERMVSISRKSEDPNQFWTFSKLITFEEGNTVASSYFIGPSQEFSEGHFIFATKKTDLNSQSKLNVSLNTDNAQIQVESIAVDKFNGNKYSTDIDLNSQKKVRIFKSGYETLEFTILPESQEDRDKLRNYDLNLEAQLMVLPVNVE
ncbi:MAG: hypothetical protein ABIM99_05270 [Candidatus Dojkabacteria bacterium]